MTVSRVERLDLRFESKPWSFAEQRRAEIDAHFTAAQRAKPQLWNGRVLVMHDYEIAGGVLRGAFLETDYASFRTWIAGGRQPAGVIDCFGSAAVLASDGGFLMAEMAAHTANAGRVYFPCGTPDPSDLRNGIVDFDHSVSRELREETGLDITDFKVEPGWIIVEEPARVVPFRVLRASVPGATLRQQVEKHMAKEAISELAAVSFVRSPADLVPAMPDYVMAFLTHVWSDR